MPDLRIKQPCPFCGEMNHLHVSEGGIPRPIVVGSVTLTGAGGYEDLEEVDGVYCEVCCSSAPLDVWNHEMDPKMLAVLRDFDPPVEGVAA